MSSTDRRMIALLLEPFFPTMKDATSDEWHGFLNAKTGLTVPLSEPNTSAFDKWRRSLAEQFDLPVWPYTPSRIAEIQQRGEELKQLEEARIAEQPMKLAQLAGYAPTKSAWDLIKDAFA